VKAGKPGPEVEKWLAALSEPPQQAMRRVRDVIAGADRRIRDHVKYNTLNFESGGSDLCAFVQWKKKTPITLMFNRGARIQGKFPHLEGEGPTARFMRFADLEEVEARAGELGKIAVAWCDLVAAEAKGGGKPPASAKKAPKQTARPRKS